MYISSTAIITGVPNPDHSPKLNLISVFYYISTKSLKTYIGEKSSTNGAEKMVYTYAEETNVTPSQTLCKYQHKMNKRSKCIF
jgi:hypothetical protein